MDEAGLRRGSVSANARWGNTVAILVGDLLFARASDLVADLGPDFVRLQARTFARLVQGQIAETVGPAPGQDRLRTICRWSPDKTGSLIATSALLAPSSPARPRSSSRSWPTSATDRHRLPAERRHHRHHERRDGQDPGHRPREASRPCRRCSPAVDRPGGRPPADLLDSDLRSDADLAEVLALLRQHRSIDEARAEYAVAPSPPAACSRDCRRSGPDSLEELCDTVVGRTA